MSRVRRDVVVLVASLAAFAVCAVIAADGRVGPVERAAFHAVNGLPEGLYEPMLAFQYLGAGYEALRKRRWRAEAALARWLTAEGDVPSEAAGGGLVG